MLSIFTIDPYPLLWGVKKNIVSKIFKGLSLDFWYKGTAFLVNHCNLEKNKLANNGDYYKTLHRIFYYTQAFQKLSLRTNHLCNFCLLLIYLLIICGPSRAWTYDLEIMSFLLLPTELWDRYNWTIWSITTAVYPLALLRNPQ